MEIKVWYVRRVPTPLDQLFGYFGLFWATLFSLPGDYLRLLRPRRHGPVFIPPVRSIGWDRGRYRTEVLGAMEEHKYQHLFEAIERQNLRDKITAKWRTCMWLALPWAFFALVGIGAFDMILESAFPSAMSRVELGRIIDRILFY